MKEVFSAIFSADTKDFDKKIKKLEKDVENIAEEVETPLNIDIQEALREIDRMRAEIATLNSERVELNLQMIEAKRNLAEFQAELSRLKDEQVKLTATINKMQFDREMAEMKAREEEFKRSATKNLYVNTKQARSEYDRVERQMRSLEMQALRMGKSLNDVMTPSQIAGYKEYQKALIDSRKAMLPFKFQQMAIQGEFYKLSKAGAEYAGNHRKWMSDIQALGAQDKKIKDAMINSNNMLRMSYVRQAGMFMNMTTQAQRISDNYKRMGNAMYSINRPGLAVANTLNKIALSGNASVLALKMLGPQAGTKDLQNMVMMINQGLMRFTMVAMAAALASYKLYSSLHKDAMKTNEVYAKAFNGMKKSLYDAFAPMRQIFQEVMISVYNFINKIGQMIQKFNEAHPTLAKFIQGIMLLIPALTLILAPLAIGIGLFNGIRAAMSAVWMLIGPLITGLTAMSGTVLLVAGIIVGLALAFKYLWENNETFRNTVISAWEFIKTKALEIWNGVKGVLIQAWESIKTKALEIWGSIQEFWAQHGESILQKASEIWNGVWNTITTVFTEIFNFIMQIWTDIITFWNQYGEQIMQAVSMVWEGIKIVINNALEYIKQIITFFMEYILPLLTTLWESAKVIIGIAWEAIKGVIQGALDIIKGIILVFTGLINMEFSTFWEGIKMIFQGALDIIVSILNIAWELIKTGVSTTWNTIKSILSTVWEAMKSIVTVVLNAIKSIITIGWNAIKTTITTVLNTIKTIVTTAWEGVKTVITGAINGIKSIITGGWNGITSFLRGIDLSAIGRQILQSLINGVESMIGSLKGVFNKITSMIPDWKGPYRVDKVLLTPAGTAIMGSLIGGLDDKTRNLKQFLNGTTDMIANAYNGMTVGNLNSQLSDLALERRSSLHSTINEEVTVQKQPAYINIRLGKNDFKTFVEDINEVNSLSNELERIYGL